MNTSDTYIDQNDYELCQEFAWGLFGQLDGECHARGRQFATEMVGVFD